MKIKNLTLKIKNKHILEDINFNINHKAAIAGPNGSGKTMTLSVLAKMIRPQYGSMIWNKKDVLKDEEFKHKLGVMIQEGNLDPDKRVIEEMNLIQKLKGDKRDIKKLLQKYDIDNVQIKKLPHGKYKILLVLQALLGKPELVILDEPFSGLDILNRKIMESILRKYKGKMLITTHLLNEVKNICDEMIFIKEGKVIRQRKTKGIKNLDNYYIRLYKK